MNKNEKHLLSVVVPCYNEENTLKESVEALLKIEDEHLSLQVLIVNDASKDKSLEIAKQLEAENPQIIVLEHKKNKGKGAALNTGFRRASGSIVAIHDADLEYDPQDLRKLAQLIMDDKADVVLGSRFLSGGVHRVLYFWHSMGNKFLTFLSNMFTDLNITDMETCYKVFRSELIKKIEIQENRFGIEPEIVAKVAQMRPRICEMSISYYGRSYEKGKKIGVSDGFRALYCIFHYNAPKAPMPIQFLIYVVIGGMAALLNLGLFLGFSEFGASLNVSILSAFLIAAIFNYFLCTLLLFRHKAKWDPIREMLIFVAVVVLVGLADLLLTKYFLSFGINAAMAKLIATGIGLILNFVGRKYLVFPESPSGSWK